MIFVPLTAALFGQEHEESLDFSFPLWTLFSPDSIGLDESLPDFGELYYRQDDQYLPVRLDYRVRLDRHTFQGTNPFTFYRSVEGEDGSDTFHPVMNEDFPEETEEVLFITIPPVRDEMLMFHTTLEEQDLEGSVLVINAADSVVVFNVDGETHRVDPGGNESMVLSERNGVFVEIRVAGPDEDRRWTMIYSRRHPRPESALVLLVYQEGPERQWKARSLALPKRD